MATIEDSDDYAPARLRRLERRAVEFVLPPTTDGDGEPACPGNPIKTWKVRSGATLAGTLSLLAASDEAEGRHWDLGSKGTTFVDEDSHVYVASRGSEPDAIVLARRGLVVDMTDRSITHRYFVEVHLVYVVPQARGQGLGSALALTLGDQVAKDIRDAVALMRSRRWAGTLSVTLWGDVRSTGGGRFLSSVESGMRRVVETLRDAHAFRFEIERPDGDWRFSP